MENAGKRGDKTHHRQNLTDVLISQHNLIIGLTDNQDIIMGATMAFKAMAQAIGSLADFEANTSHISKGDN